MRDIEMYRELTFRSTVPVVEPSVAQDLHCSREEVQITKKESHSHRIPPFVQRPSI
jgi:hypothetical protein